MTAPLDTTDARPGIPTDTSTGGGRRRSKWRALSVFAIAMAATAITFGAVWAVMSPGRDEIAVLDPLTATGRSDGRGADGSVGVSLPDVALTDSAGTMVRTGELVGAPLVMNFWYSTCPPCRRELPVFAEVHRELDGRVRFVGVNPLDSPEAAEQFAARYEVGFETLFDRDGNLSAALGIVGYPTTVLVDVAGTVVFQHTGELDADALRQAITDRLPRSS